MAGKINNAPPPDAPFGTVDGSGRVTVSPLWYRWLTTKQNAGEILVEGSVTSSVLDPALLPPNVSAVTVAAFSLTAQNLASDTEANRDLVLTIATPATTERVQFEAWATGDIDIAGAGVVTVDVTAHIIAPGGYMNPSSPQVYYSHELQGPGFTHSGTFTSSTVTSVAEPGAPASSRKLLFKFSAPGSETVDLSNVTLYLKTTTLS
jgi:hypothetical protein